MKVAGIGTAVPEGVIEQRDAAAISRGLVTDKPAEGRLVEALFRRSGVSRRHSVLIDPAADDAPVQDFYAARRGEGDRGPGTAARMQRYETEAGTLAVAASRRGLADAAVSADSITHLVTVTCTGFHAPGPDIELIDELGLSPDVGRTSVGFMGCHGAFNGLRVAEALVRADPDARVLVCAVELCSLHFSYAFDSEKLVANALFADGAAAFVALGQNAGALSNSPALQLDSFGSRLIPGTRDAMSWRVGDNGFEMTLSAEVPRSIREHVPGWLAEWAAAHGRDIADTDCWAVHPGGPRILGAVGEAMGLEDDALALSREILAGYGNMSSATIGFILDRMRRERRPRQGVALGFGPGLMAEAFTFRTLQA